MNIKVDFDTKHHKLFLSFEVPFHAVKKNGRVIHGRGEKKWIGKSSRLKSAEEYMSLQFRQALQKLPRGFTPLKGDIHAIYRFYIPSYFTKDGKRSRKIPDLSNLLELPSDELQKAGLIEDDSDIVSFDGSGRFPGENNVLEIELRVIKDGVYGSQRCPLAKDCPRMNG